MTTSPTSVNVASHLARMAAEFPGKPAVHIPLSRVKHVGTTPHRTITFAELNADADAIAHGLASAGITRGVRTVLMVPPGADFFAVTFALFKVGAVPILIDPGMGLANLGRCLAEAEPEAFVGVAKAHLARRLFAWARRSVRTTVNVGRWRFFCNHSSDQLRTIGRGLGSYSSPNVAINEPAAILFTSGSTGAAKGVEYTHGNFDAQVRILKETYGIAPGEIDLCTFPLFALFGPALGMTCIVPDMDATRPADIDPNKAIAQIRQFGVTNLFGSPAVVRRLGGQDVPVLTTLRRVISAGAPASAATLERMVRLLPSSVQVYTPYGATEALPVSNIGSQEILGETRQQTERGRGVCVGRPVAGVEVRVVAITDEAIPVWKEELSLPAGTIGEFVVRGPVVTKRYFHRDDATQRAKIYDEAGQVLHRMGDVGYIDEQGRLWFCGRKAHRVEAAGATLFTDMVEPVFNTVAGVARTALVGVTRKGTTMPVLCVEMDGSRSESQVRDDLRALAPTVSPTAAIQTFLFHPRFPVDVRHNSKIFREKLAVWADHQLGAGWQGGSS